MVCHANAVLWLLQMSTLLTVILMYIVAHRQLHMLAFMS